MSKRIVVLISGGGTNLQALIDAIADGTIKNGQIVSLISNKANAYGLVRAEKAQIETAVFSAKGYESREAYDADLANKVKTYAPDLIVLAGWMRILTPAFLDHFPNKVINLHPALPGEFAGINAIERAFEAFQNGELDHSGCMIHYVIPEVDAGPVIAQAVVPFKPDDTLETFAQRLHTAEHQLIVQAVKQVIETS